MGEEPGGQTDQTLLASLEAVKGLLHSLTEAQKTSLFIYLCSFTLVYELIEKGHRPQPITIGKLSSWATEFFSEYPHESFETTYKDFVTWVDERHEAYTNNLN
jgi:hypothetical protein